MPSRSSTWWTDSSRRWIRRNAAAELNLTADELKQQFTSPFLRNNRDHARARGEARVHPACRATEFLTEFQKLRDLMADGRRPRTCRRRCRLPPQPGKSFTLILRAPDAKMEMIWIEPGTFLMGSPETEANRFDNEDQHQVRLTRGFWLSKTEVTQGQYQALAGDNPSHFKDSGPDAPVDTVSWDQAMAFCRAANDLVEDLPDGYRFSLPTEAQWEFACRAGTEGPIYGSSLDAIAWYEGNSEGRTHPAGTKQANRGGSRT